jgi:hypothetical protein
MSTRKRHAANAGEHDGLSRDSLGVGKDIDLIIIWR